MKTTLRISLIFSLALLLVVIAIEGAPRQNAPQHSVRAHVIDGLTGEPVPRVRFTFSGSALQDGIAGTGDAEGNIVITDLPAGSYQLNITKGQFFDVPLDVNLTNIEMLTLPDVALTKKREISGIARWQDGEPAAGAVVQVTPLRGGKIQRSDTVINLADGFIAISGGVAAASSISTSGQAQSAAANDRGEFTFTGLRPGRYVLMVRPLNGGGGLDNLGRSVAGGIPRLALPVYYPGLNVPDARSIIDLRGVLNVQNINVVLEEKERTVVEGTVLPSTVAPVGSNVSLKLSIPGLLAYQISAHVGDPFQFTSVPAGTYVLDAQNQGSPRGRMLQLVTVAGPKISGLTISIPPAADVTGRVEIDDALGRTKAQLLFQSERIQGQTSALVGVGEDFRVQGMVPGEPYSLTVPNIPSTAYLSAVMQGTQELSGAPYRIYGGGDPIRIVLKTDGGTIEGTVKQNGVAIPKAFVVAAPKDRKKEQYFRTVLSAENGSFKLTGLAPGDYELFALNRNENDDYLDEDFLQTIAVKSMSLSVEPHSSQKFEIPLQNIPQH